MSIITKEKIIPKDLFLKYLHDRDTPQQKLIKNTICTLQNNIHNTSKSNINLEIEDIPLVFKNSKNIFVLSMETLNLKEAIDYIIELFSSRKNDFSFNSEIIIHFGLQRGDDIKSISKYLDELFNILGKETVAAVGISTNCTIKDAKIHLLIGLNR